MYRRLPNWVLGFHGTDVATVKKILCNPNSDLHPSTNEYDWLGWGVYFWENDPERALQFARESFQRNGIRKKPAVIGAVIDLGLCLNLFDQAALSELRLAHEEMSKDMGLLEIPMPVNAGGKDRLRRNLDCAVIEHLHRLRKQSSSTPQYQTVRSGFHEGGDVYEGSGFQTKNHIQIAVRNLSCIKGYFLPRTRG